MRTRLALFVPLLLVSATAPPAISQPTATPAKPEALAGVPTDSFAFLTVNVGKLWDNPDFKPLRDWFTAQKSGPTEDAIGVPMGEIERLTLFVPAMTRDPEPLLLVTTKKPYNEAKLIKLLNGERESQANSNIIRTKGGAFSLIVLADDRTVLYVPERGQLTLAGLVGQLVAKKTDGPLAVALVDAAKHDIAFALDARPLAEFARASEIRELAPYVSLLKARTVTFAADFDKTARGALKITFPDAAGAKRAAPVLKEGLSEITDAAEKGLAGRKEKEDSAEHALIGAFIAVLKAAKIEANGVDVFATADLPYQDAIAKIATALPKSYTAAANSARGLNNLKQLALGMYNYESALGFFPSDVYPFGDKPPAWSWRVQILPYIEQDNLYKVLDLTKSWDDPANLKKLEAMEMPKVFEIPGRPAPKGHTYFRIFTLPKGAKGTDRPLLTEGQKGPRVTEITDGTSNTFMIVEAGEAVPWYKPDVLAYDGKLPLPQLGDKNADKFIAAMGDGSVRILRPSKVGEQTLRSLVTIQGGEVINLP